MPTRAGRRPARPHLRRGHRRFTLLATATVGLLLASGCASPLVVTRSGGDAGSDSGMGSSGTTETDTVSDGTTTGTGAVTLTLTEPVPANGSGPAAVTCTESGRIYQAQTSSTQIGEHQLSFTVRIARHTGAGSYLALVTMRVDGTDGTVSTVSGIPAVPAEIDAAGNGQFAIDATGANGRSLVATVAWTCAG
ncbi:hypothetical protein ACN27F_05320 [Solwaraspora sp. WMMB335]|uniref:hypothetical protein n=1 Tax=Solwaraspora sp. WMMB335 TaxID=3404118 RepID=UPI003B937C14